MQLRRNASKVYSNKKEKASKKASCEHRPSSLHNDRKNTRGPEGKNMVRRTNTTTCAVKKELTCKMFFAVSWDRVGFFFSAGNGCANHNDHIQLNRNETLFPKRLIESLERDVTESCGKSDVALLRGRQGALSTQHKEPPAKSMAQESVVYDDSDDDDDNCTTSGIFNDTVVALRSNPLLPPQPFVELNPVFKELCALYKDNCTCAELESIQATMSDLITKKRSEIATRRLLGQPQVGTLISPHVVSSKRRKTNGNKHMK